MNGLSMNPQVWGPWICTIQLVAFLFAALSLPTTVPAGSIDRWQQWTDAGTAAREQARYKDAEQFFLMAEQEAQGIGPHDGVGEPHGII